MGKYFTHKQVLKLSKTLNCGIFQAMFGWRKSCEELIKRMDPDLPYYYHTSTYNRFYEGELPKFDEPAHRTKKQRPPRRELLSGSVGGRVTLVPCGSVSIRSQFHNVPVDLPPPPSQPSHTSDHQYQDFSATTIISSSNV